MMSANSIAMVVLGGSIWQGPQDRWQTNGLDGPGDTHGPTFDRFRVVAASYLFRETAPGILIIASGGKAAQDRPSIASVIRDELISLGIPGDSIIEEDQSEDTHQQLKGVCQIIKDRCLMEVHLISNEWHLPRIQVMVECSPALETLRQIRWTLVSAEEVMLSSDLCTWRSIIENMRSDPRTPQRIALEKKGERELREGIYRLT
jgi:hypothetical protein